MKLIIFILLFSYGLGSIAQNSIDVIYATDSIEYFYDGDIDLNNNYVFCGVQEIANEKFSIWPLLLKRDPNGGIIAKTIIKKDTTGWFETIEILYNGNYMFIGSCDKIDTTNTLGYKQKNIWVYITDSLLNLISENYYDVSNYYFNNVSINKSFINLENEIICWGNIKCEPNGHVDELYIKLNQNGDTIFTKIDYELAVDKSYELTQVPNQNEYINFYHDNLSKGWDKIVRMDSAFNITNEILNLTDYNSLIEPWISGTHWVSDTSFILASHVLGLYDKYQDDQIGVFLIDTNGNFQKETYLGKADTTDYPAWFRPLAFGNDSSIYVAGFTTYQAPLYSLPTYIEIYLFDREMNLLGYKVMGGDAFYNIGGLYGTNNNSVIIYGNILTGGLKSKYDWDSDIFITEILRSEIELITSVNETKTQFLKNIITYPNPVIDNLNFYLSGSTNNLFTTKLQIFKLSGIKVFEKQMTCPENTLSVNVKNLNAGIYIYRLINIVTDEIDSGKFIKN